MVLLQPKVEEELDTDDGEVHYICCLDDYKSLCGLSCIGEMVGPVNEVGVQVDCLECKVRDTLSICPILGVCPDDEL